MLLLHDRQRHVGDAELLRRCARCAVRRWRPWRKRRKRRRRPAAASAIDYDGLVSFVFLPVGLFDFRFLLACTYRGQFALRWQATFSSKERPMSDAAQTIRERIVRTLRRTLRSGPRLGGARRIGASFGASRAAALSRSRCSARSYCASSARAHCLRRRRAICNRRTFSFCGKKRSVMPSPTCFRKCRGCARRRCFCCSSPTAVGCRSCRRWRGKPFPNDHLDLFFNATVDAAIVMATFMHAADAVGLGCCPISMIRNHAAAVSELAGLPEKVVPIAGMTVGWPAEEGVISPRLPLVGHRARGALRRRRSRRQDRRLRPAAGGGAALPPAARPRALRRRRTSTAGRRTRRGNTRPRSAPTSAPSCGDKASASTERMARYLRSDR